jgi:hypothetical protein
MTCVAATSPEHEYILLIRSEVSYVVVYDPGLSMSLTLFLLFLLTLLTDRWTLLGADWLKLNREPISITNERTCTGTDWEEQIGLELRGVVHSCCLADAFLMFRRGTTMS